MVLAIFHQHVGNIDKASPTSLSQLEVSQRIAERIGIINSKTYFNFAKSVFVEHEFWFLDAE